MKTALAGSVLLCVALMGATCWRWSGAQARAMSLEQAVNSIENHRPVAVPIVWADIAAMIDRLEQCAKLDGEAGDAARHALDQLRRRLSR